MTIVCQAGSKLLGCGLEASYRDFLFKCVETVNKSIAFQEVINSRKTKLADDRP